MRRLCVFISSGRFTFLFCFLQLLQCNLIRARALSAKPEGWDARRVRAPLCTFPVMSGRISSQLCSWLSENEISRERGLGGGGWGAREVARKVARGVRYIIRCDADYAYVPGGGWLSVFPVATR